MHFFVTDGFVDETQKEEISSMINVKVSTNYFLVRMNELSCYNKQFNIRSGTARGKVEMLMLSLVTNKFPTRIAEKFFLKEADAFISFLRSQPYPELVLHLEKDVDDEEFQLVEETYEKTLQHLRDLLDRFN